MNLDSLYEITENQISEFTDSGFIFLPSILNEEEINYYKNVIDRVVEEITSGDKRPLHERSAYEREFLQCGHLWSKYPEIKKLTLSKRLGYVANKLLKSEHVRLWHDQALYKLPGGDATEPHQDLAYWPMLDRNAGTIWLALEEVTIEMGAMHFIPYSHKVGIDSYRHRIEDAINGESNLIEKADKLIQKEHVAFNLKPGDATFHHGLTVHYTKKNNSDKIRKGMTVIYYSDGVRFDGNSPEKEHFCASGSEHGKPIATELNPIIY